MAPDEESQSKWPRKEISPVHWLEARLATLKSLRGIETANQRLAGERLQAILEEIPRVEAAIKKLKE